MWRLAVPIEDEDLGHRPTQSDGASSHTRHSNPTAPRLLPASTILWTSDDDDTRYYHALDGGFASKRYAYSRLLALYGYWDDLWSCSGSTFADTACAPGRSVHGETQREHTMVSANADLGAALWAGGNVDAELIHVCPDVPDPFRRARPRHHLVRAGENRTALCESCTEAVGGARAHFSRIAAGTGGGVAAAASVRAAAVRAPLRERDRGRDRWFDIVAYHARDCLIDDEIYEDTLKTFPELAENDHAKLVKLNEEEMKNPEGTEGWRVQEVKDYNFGSLTQTDAHQEHGENNTIFDDAYRCTRGDDVCSGSRGDHTMRAVVLAVTIRRVPSLVPTSHGLRRRGEWMAGACVVWIECSFFKHTPV
ncbi:hypothetical protein DFH08DRAFT_942804 [Mycena albidolilacea]|uniref:Polysaccharide biosynthesis domain-containing protein n=1 Tax=Mycena albidolilacea TaxID=1033008 RepID=A0AAD6ZCD0_9AGAR|nr:hypothetical protein DFH08DRAFT_942804 [Mycena albidolilacea]